MTLSIEHNRSYPTITSQDYIDHIADRDKYLLEFTLKQYCDLIHAKLKDAFSQLVAANIIPTDQYQEIVIPEDIKSKLHNRSFYLSKDGKIFETKSENGLIEANNLYLIYSAPFAIDTVAKILASRQLTHRS